MHTAGDMLGIASNSVIMTDRQVFAATHGQLHGSCWLDSDRQVGCAQGSCRKLTLQMCSFGTAHLLAGGGVEKPLVGNSRRLCTLTGEVKGFVVLRVGGLGRVARAWCSRISEGLTSGTNT